MAEHYIITANQHRFSIYLDQVRGPGQMHAPLEHVLTGEIDAAQGNYFARDTDQAGRFHGSPNAGRGHGGSIDERLPMKEEGQARIRAELVARLTEFLEAHPKAAWSFAAGPVVHNAVLDHLSPGLLVRLHKSIQKELVNTPPSELRSHFHRMAA